MPLIIPANTLTGGYTVANSCRFNNDDSPYMHKTPAGAGNRRTFTISVWFKTSTVAGGNSYILSTGDYDGGEGFFQIKLSNAGRLTIDDYDTSGSSYNLRWVTPSTYLIRDPSAWYHLVVAVDSTDATESNRVKVYLNGTNISSGFTQTTTPSQNDDFHVNLDQIVQIGRSQNNDAYFDGYLAEFCIIDGSQLAATSFGEFDEDSPTIWKPIDVSGLTFGTNGFYLDFEDSANLGNDANGGTDLTEVNLAATDQATDTPTNNFATFNPLTPSRQSGGVVAYSEGNVNIVTSYTDTNYLRFPQAYSTLGATAGKWYAEFKPTAMGSAAVGIANTGEFGSDGSSNPYAGYAASGAVYTNGGEYRANDGSSGGQGTYTTNDIIGVAMDLDNLKLYWHKNGTYINSGDPESGATGTGARAIVAPATPGGFYVFTAGSDNSSVATISGNFGNPSYANSSSVSDANGYGAFEYTVPSGYFALCTKNLGSDGG